MEINITTSIMLSVSLIMLIPLIIIWIIFRIKENKTNTPISVINMKMELKRKQYEKQLKDIRKIPKNKRKPYHDNLEFIIKENLKRL